jgi:hypothetical protein
MKELIVLHNIKSAVLDIVEFIIFLRIENIVILQVIKVSNFRILSYCYFYGFCC